MGAGCCARFEDVVVVVVVLLRGEWGVGGNESKLWLGWSLQGQGSSSTEGVPSQDLQRTPVFARFRFHSPANRGRPGGEGGGHSFI